MVEVKVLPNPRRPDVGQKPVKEERRAWLPQHSRFCPVLEAGSGLGYLVFPPLEDDESYQMRYMQGNSYRFSFFINDAQGNPDLVFVIMTTPSAGSGMLVDELVYRDPGYGMDDAQIRQLKEALLVNLDSPPGGVGLRAATDFVTPEGWDTVYTGLFNEAQPPHLPVLTARVQTDWYAQNTEFRYILQPGDVVSAAPTTPIGQVFFVPREEVKLQPGTERDIARFNTTQQQYWEGKAKDQLVAPYGMKYSPHYRKSARPQR